MDGFTIKNCNRGIEAYTAYNCVGVYDQSIYTSGLIDSCAYAGVRMFDSTHVYLHDVTIGHTPYAVRMLKLNTNERPYLEVYGGSLQGTTGWGIVDQTGDATWFPAAVKVYGANRSDNDFDLSDGGSTDGFLYYYAYTDTVTETNLKTWFQDSLRYTGSTPGDGFILVNPETMSLDLFQ